MIVYAVRYVERGWESNKGIASLYKTEESAKSRVDYLNEHDEDFFYFVEAIEVKD